MPFGKPTESEIDGHKVRVSESMTRRNRHGAMSYMVEVLDGADVIHTEFVDQSRWLGHSWGQLLLPQIVSFAMASR